MKKLLSTLLIASLLVTGWGQVVQAGVSDNVSNSSLEQSLGDAEGQTVFGLLRDIVAMLVSMQSEQSNFYAQIDAKINALNRSTSSIVYVNSQVRSVNVTSTGPTSILVYWDCTKDTDCLNNSQNPEGIDISTIKKFNVYYSSVDASAKTMQLASTLTLDASKDKTWDYSCAIEGLQPNTQYYIWVTSVLDDGLDTEMSDTSGCQITRTTTIEQAAAQHTAALPKDATVLKVTWTDGITGTPEMSDFVDHYDIYYSTDILNESNILDCATKKESNSCEVLLSGLSIGAYYYIGVVPVMKDPAAGSITDNVIVIYASTELSENGGELVFVDLDNDGTDESVLCTIVFGNTGQIKNQTQATLDGLVNTYLENTEGTYYSEGLRSLINDDGKKLHLLTNEQIDNLISRNVIQDISFVADNQPIGTAPNIAYTDTTGITNLNCFHKHIQNGMNLIHCSSYEYGAESCITWTGCQVCINTTTFSKSQYSWGGIDHGYPKNVSTPSVPVGLIGYFNLSDLQGY